MNFSLMPPFQSLCDCDCDVPLPSCVHFGMNEKTITVIISSVIVGAFSIYQAGKKINKHKHIIKEKVLTGYRTIRASSRRSIPEMMDA